VDLGTAANELYGLAPGEFTSARERLARATRGEDRGLAEQIHQLRRPSLSAWALNAFSRRHGDEIDRLLSLGTRLREAQRSLAGEHMRLLAAERRDLVAALLAEVRRLARELGEDLSDQVAGEVGRSLEAALADPSAAEQMRSGCLTTALSHVGFGADMDGTAPSPPARPGDHRSADRAPAEDRGGPEARRSERIAKARHDLEEAEKEARRATQALGAARSAVEHAAEEHEGVRQRIEALESDLREAKPAAAQAAREVADAERALGRAERQAESAHRRVEAARQQVDRSIED
jgi:hypothetical protein